MHKQATSQLRMVGRALDMAPHALVSLTDDLPLVPRRVGSSAMHVCD